MSQDQNDRFFTIIVLIFIGGIGSAILAGLSTNSVCTKKLITVKIGACNKFGDCDALMSDGQVHHLTNGSIVEGQPACVETKTVNHLPWESPKGGV